MTSLAYLGITDSETIQTIMNKKEFRFALLDPLDRMCKSTCLRSKYNT